MYYYDLNIVIFFFIVYKKFKNNNKSRTFLVFFYDFLVSFMNFLVFFSSSKSTNWFTNRNRTERKPIKKNRLKTGETGLEPNLKTDQTGSARNRSSQEPVPNRFGFGKKTGLCTSTGQCF